MVYVENERRKTIPFNIQMHSFSSIYAIEKKNDLMELILRKLEES